MRILQTLAVLALAALTAPSIKAAGSSGRFTMGDVLGYSFVSNLTAAERADEVAWVGNTRGVRNVWLARGPDFVPRQLTHYTEDDGQEITQLTFAPDGGSLVFVRGGDHDANWPAEGNLAPDPTSSPVQPAVSIWRSFPSSGSATRVADGDGPAISGRGQLAYIKDGQVWTVGPNAKPARMFFDRGRDSALRWSPDGSRLAFISDRGDHAFIGIYAPGAAHIVYLAPSTGYDTSPCWSPDGQRIAFVREPGKGGAPEPLLKQVPSPWSLWIADAQNGTGHLVWQSPDTLDGSRPDREGGFSLHWTAGDRLIFIALLDGWPHLYSIRAAGGSPILLTPGAYMVEDVTETRDHRYVLYDANTGDQPNDGERRHVFIVPIDRPEPRVITSGASLEWTPVAAADDRIAFIRAGARRPPAIELTDMNGRNGSPLTAERIAGSFPLAKLVVPKAVTFYASDGTLIHGQLFKRNSTVTKSRLPEPGVIFVHGGPSRQMLLGWHPMDYYSNAYAVNQYLATHGFVVLSINYRLSTGYGRKFHQPKSAGPLGASEYQDLVAGARYLQRLPGVDSRHIGIWGGSYGGYLTALALARNSDLFAAGVDWHGVHDWTQLFDLFLPTVPPSRFEKGDRVKATEIAWSSSPDSAIDQWRSPILLVQGDDDRNVPFHQMIDVANRLHAHGVPFEELVIPNEIHGFLRYSTLLRVDEATVAFFRKTLLSTESVAGASAFSRIPRP